MAVRTKNNNNNHKNILTHSVTDLSLFLCIYNTGGSTLQFVIEVLSIQEDLPHGGEGAPSNLKPSMVLGPMSPKSLSMIGPEAIIAPRQ